MALIALLHVAAALLSVAHAGFPLLPKDAFRQALASGLWAWHMHVAVVGVALVLLFVNRVVVKVCCVWIPSMAL